MKYHLRKASESGTHPCFTGTSHTQINNMQKVVYAKENYEEWACKAIRSYDAILKYTFRADIVEICYT